MDNVSMFYAFRAQPESAYISNQHGMKKTYVVSASNVFSALNVLRTKMGENEWCAILSRQSEQEIRDCVDNKSTLIILN